MNQQMTRPAMSRVSSPVHEAGFLACRSTKDRDGMMGIVDFAYEEDMRYAIKKLDDTEFEKGCIVFVTERHTGHSSSRQIRF